MEPCNLTLFLPDNLFAHLLFFNIQNFESYRRYRNSSSRVTVTKKNAHIKMSAKASLLNKNKSGKKKSDVKNEDGSLKYRNSQFRIEQPKV